MELNFKGILETTSQIHSYLESINEQTMNFGKEQFESIKEELGNKFTIELNETLEQKQKEIENSISEELKKMKENMKCRTPNRKLESSPQSEIDISFCSKMAETPFNEFSEKLIYI